MEKLNPNNPMNDQKNICFDAYNIDMRHGTGVATYARSLAKATREIGHKTSILYARRGGSRRRPLESEVRFFDEAKERLRRSLAERLWGIGPYFTTLFGMRAHRIPVSGLVLTRPLAPNWVDCDSVFSTNDVFARAQANYFATRLMSRIRMEAASVDIFHWTYPLPLKADGAANIYTIHDLVPLRLPYTTLDRKRYFISLLRNIVRKADHIVTVSESSKRDIVRFLDADEGRVTNTYQAVDIPESLRKRASHEIANELDRAFGLEFGGYHLFYGSIEPKKNLGRVIQAFLRAKATRPLVIVSAQSWLGESETRLMKQIIHDDETEWLPKKLKRIRHYEYMPFRVLVTLIRGARSVLCPSVYEGFGLPVLEAMSLGAPVISSTESSIPEVAGDACLLVDPYDVSAIAEAITKLDRDDDVCGDLRARGLVRAEMFSREAYEGRLRNLYARAA